jgi:colanic acid/amylovoran biosynthesis glycosyltransferase
MNDISKQSLGDKHATRICVVTPYPPSPSETFIRGHIEGLPAKVILVHGWRPTVGSRTVLPLSHRVAHKTWRMFTGSGLERETTAAYTQAFKRYRAAAVLAEYGTTGVQTMEACRRLGMPLIVHFHGYDASEYSVLQEHAKTYPLMFNQADAIIAVSQAMRRKLIAIGAPPEKIHYNPYGVDCKKFGGAEPASAPPTFIAIGRFTEKKAPQLTLAAFAQVHRTYSDARLRMIGEGPLMDECRELAEQLGISDVVTFLGGQGPEVVERELRQSRCFVQHSVESSNGDSEGTPVSILEAGATGLPVVSTRHAGIPDVVIEGETGFLVDERDVDAMAQHMMRIVEEPNLARELGCAARRRIQQHFAKEQQLGSLWRIIESCIQSRMLQRTN